MHHSSTCHQFMFIFGFIYLCEPLKFVQDIFNSHPQDKPRPRILCATNATKLVRVINRDVVAGRFRESGSDISFHAWAFSPTPLPRDKNIRIRESMQRFVPQNLQCMRRNSNSSKKISRYHSILVNTSLRPIQYYPPQYNRLWQVAVVFWVLLEHISG